MFSGRSENQDNRPVLSLAMTFSTSPLHQQNEIQRNFTGSKISTSLFVFFRPIGKSRLPPWPLIDWDVFSTSLFQPLNDIQRNLSGSKIPTSSTKFFFGPIRWPRLFNWPLICLKAFWLLLCNRWTEFNETW